MEWAAQRLAPAKRPRSVYVVAELPRTSVGKIRKFLLTTPAEAPVEASTSDL
jgi:crotonobetaine/carnitine-CoA ligase